MCCQSRQCGVSTQRWEGTARKRETSGRTYQVQKRSGAVGVNEREFVASIARVQPNGFAVAFDCLGIVFLLPATSVVA